MTGRLTAVSPEDRSFRRKRRLAGAFESQPSTERGYIEAEFERFVTALVSSPAVAGSGHQPRGAGETRAIRRPATAEHIIARAMAILDEEGERALTIRRVAADLGISTRTLYKRFASRDALLHAIAESYASTLSPPFRHLEPWKDTVLRWCTELHVELTSHPHLLGLVADDLVTRLHDGIADVANYAVCEGIAPENALNYARTAVVVTVGDALAQVRSGIRGVGQGSANESASLGYSDAIALLLDGVVDRAILANESVGAVIEEGAETT